MIKPKILAPAGDLIALKAAIDAGCDEVYLGLKGFNMRVGAKNFSLAELKKAEKLCNKNNVKIYVAINTIIYENELKKLEKILAKLKTMRITGIIAWDMSVIAIADKLGFEINLSTQASISNYQALKFYKKHVKNLKRVVLARECSLNDIKSIVKKIKKDKLNVDIECFIHGAICVSVSGRCFMSQELFNKSANRGECLQPCRRKYIVKDSEENHELAIGEDYVMSPNDLCTMPFIEKLIDSGISSFKIEGRNRSPEYVSTVVSCYRTILDYYYEYRNKIKKNKQEQKDFNELKNKLAEKLRTVYYRGFSSGFFMGKPVNEWSKVYGSKSKELKQYVGKVVNYYSKPGVAEVKVESYLAELNDKVIFIGPTTGIVSQIIEYMRDDSGNIAHSKQGSLITIKTNKKVRKNDLMYKIISRKQE